MWTLCWDLVVSGGVICFVFIFVLCLKTGQEEGPQGRGGEKDEGPHG